MVLGSLLCTGDEESLTDCPRGRAGDFSCSRYNRIASVVCSNGKSTCQKASITSHHYIGISNVNCSTQRVNVKVDKYIWLVELSCQKDEWKCVITAHGDVFVIDTGMLMMLESSADN